MFDLTPLPPIDPIFPLTRPTSLRVWGILSVWGPVATMLNDSNCVLAICGAYSKEEAEALNNGLIETLKGEQSPQWRRGVIVGSLPFENMVPPDEIDKMVQKMRVELEPKRETQDEKKSKSVADIVSYVRYMLDISSATTEEKEMTEKMIERFEQNTGVAKSKGNG